MYENTIKSNEEEIRNATNILDSQKKITRPLNLSIKHSVQSQQSFSMNFWGEGPFSDELIVNFNV